MLRLELLGGFRAITERGESQALARQPRRAALLALLALEREAPRGKVISILWPEADTDRGRHSLNQGIYSLRRIIGADWIELRGDRCVVAPWVSTDVEELERAAAAGDHERVISLYRGPLFAGAVLDVTVDFDVWLAHRRSSVERLHRSARSLRLAELTQSGRTADALACAEAWCRLEPLEDEAQHRYIELLAETGQRADALQQFRSYSRLLDEEGLRPLDDTLALVEQLQQGEVGALPPAAVVAADGAAAREDTAAARVGPAAAPAPAAGAPELPARTASPVAWNGGALLGTRTGLTLLTAAVFATNLVETTLEGWIEPHLPGLAARRLQLARAAHWLEGGYGFEHHELAGRGAAMGFSAAYFFVFPLLLLGVAVALARRPQIRPFRVFSLATVAVYLVCLPFFLLLPVPERWWFPESGAVLLSDIWSVHLIDAIRPISGLDNSFPSVHVALTVVAVASCFVWRLRYRWSALFLGCAVVLSTLALGIHWLPDLIAGAATGVIAVALGLRGDARLGRTQPPPARARPHAGAALSSLAATPSGGRG